jgi:autoinducer 2-degrading protein
MICVVAKLEVSPEKAEEFIQVFKKLSEQVKNEEGTLMYTLGQDKAEPSNFYVMEKYKDEEALKFHSSTPHFMEFFGTVQSWLTGPGEIRVLDEVSSI